MLKPGMLQFRGARVLLDFRGVVRHLELSCRRMSDKGVSPPRGEGVAIEHRRRGLSAPRATWTGHPWAFERLGHFSFAWRGLLLARDLLPLLHQRAS